jgi:hypothetical protein
MPLLRTALLLAAFALPAAAAAQVTPGNLPGEAVWYLHADLEELRSAASGKHVYAWLEKEVFTDIREDLGIDLGREASSVTAFSDASLGTVIVVDGAVADTTRDKLLALAAADSKLDTLKHDGKTYYHAERGKERSGSDRAFEDDLEKSAYFSFDVKNKVIVASDPEQMKALLESGGRIAGNQSHPGTLLVLTADKSFVQAGARTAKFTDEDDEGWDSNILRNTELVALLVSDRNGLIAVEAQLVSHEPAMAQSLGGIINGLISLQALNSDLDPQILSLMRNMRVDVKDKILSISAVVDPQMVIDLLND